MLKQFNLKDEILNATDGGLEILCDIFPNSRETIGTKKKFKIRDEKTPSANFYKSTKTGYWNVKDLGDSFPAMNAIDAFMWHEGMDKSRFFEACLLLAERYNVDYSLKPEINKPKYKEFCDAESGAKEKDYSIKVRDEFTDDELKVWGAFVKPTILEKYNYKVLEEYTYNFIGSKNNRLTTVKVAGSPDFPIFFHDCGSFGKIYCPLAYDKIDRFLYVGNKDENYINGLDVVIADYEKLQEAKEHAKEVKIDYHGRDKLEAIFICSGERDAMNIAGMGYYPIWFNSEVVPSAKVVTELLRYADAVYNIPDLDAKGEKNGIDIALTYPEIYTIEIPRWILGFNDIRKRCRKDLRDFLELRPSQQEFKKLIQTAKQAKFWEIKTSDKGIRCDIKTANLLHYLRLNGFYKIKDGLTGEMKLVQVVGFRVEETNPKQIRDFIRMDLKKRQVENIVLEAYLNSKKTTQSLYDDLDTIELNFAVATPNTRTLFFQNCYVEISADNLNIVPLRRQDQIRTYCRSERIIPHNFKRLQPAFTFNGDDFSINYPQDKDGNLLYPQSKVFRYLINASRLYWRKEMEEKALTDKEQEMAYRKNMRFNLFSERLDPNEVLDQIMSLLNKLQVIGYILRKHKEPDTAKLVWIMDNKLSGSEESSGGTGKSMFVNILDKLRLTTQEHINARRVDEKGDTFLFGSVTEQTDIVYFEDAKKSFDVTTLYPVITGKMPINPKNKSSFSIEYEKSPLLVVSSNFPPANYSRDGSTSRRVVPVVMADYYHEKIDGKNDYDETRKISDDLDGQNLFGSDYTEEDYNADYNLIIDCIQLFMQHNKTFMLPKMDNVHKRGDIMTMGDDFRDWAEEYFAEDSGNLDKLIPRIVVYESYRASLGNTSKVKGKKGFRDALRSFAHFHGYEVTPPELKCIQKDGRAMMKCRIGYETSISREMIYLRTPGTPLNNELDATYRSI